MDKHTKPAVAARRLAHAALARRIADERAMRSWSLAELSQRSGVSRAMLSKVERSEASPTATVLMRIAAAFETTLADLLSEKASAPRHLSRDEQPTWMDPASGYRRRQIYLSASLPLELVEVVLPPGAAISAPASAYALIRQVLWVLEGKVVIDEGGTHCARDWR
ncbi:helix-turn-helix domain-containing protein [Bradyrhizobium sp. HKCCYLS2038]|uniref:helix-turn-helix domain-containing protein n=1 Tax=Bradyrhizobium sp. HKCCYLRH3095 TaxID=3420765 RepID=UPI003EB83B7D